MLTDFQRQNVNTRLFGLKPVYDRSVPGGSGMIRVHKYYFFQIWFVDQITNVSCDTEKYVYIDIFFSVLVAINM